MKTKLQLEFLGSLKRARLRAKGFTLVELMIVVGVVGVLSAIAVPRYIHARNAAGAGALIGEQLGLAKECASWVLSGGIGAQPTALGRECRLNQISTYGGCWGGMNGIGPVSNGLRCLQASNGGGTGVTILVYTTGELTCSFSGPRA